MTSTTRADSPATSAPMASSVASRPVAQHVAVLLAGGIALLYGLLYLGVLQIAGATDAERGILGVAGAVFAVLAGLLWWRRSQRLWVGVIALQLLMGWMYLAIAPDRDPSFEVWGVTIRVLSLALVLVLVRLLVASRADRTEGRS